MKSEKPTPQDYENWTNDPDNWVWGIFYFNTEDDRLLPPKRIKELGWTVNFANPYSFAILLAILCLIPLALLNR